MSRTVTRIAVLLRRLRQRPGVADGAVLGRCELAALAAGLALGDALDARVAAVALGPPEFEDDALAVALAAGCDDAVQIEPPDDALDYLGVATILSVALMQMGADALVCGDRSEDELQGAVGPAVAELLTLPHVTGVLDATVEPSGAADVAPGIIATQRADGWLHRIRCPAAVALCVTRFPIGPALSAAVAGDGPDGKRGAIRRLTLEALELDPRGLHHRRTLIGEAHAVRPGKRATIVSDAAELVARLVEDRVLG